MDRSHGLGNTGQAHANHMYMFIEEYHTRSMERVVSSVDGYELAWYILTHDIKSIPCYKKNHGKR